MTINEIFTALASHMETGINVHKDFINVYNFLYLKGYKKCHEYHYLEEIQGYYNLCHYYMDHYHQMIEVAAEKPVEIIPTSWYKHTQFDVDIGTKRGAIRDLMKQWVEWEKATKELMQTLYKELCDLGEVAAAKEIEKYIRDVSEELAGAEKKWLKLETIGYDIGLIMDEQESLYKKYSNKIKNLF